jgi:hypothetical protein
MFITGNDLYGALRRAMSRRCRSEVAQACNDLIGHLSLNGDMPTAEMMGETVARMDRQQLLYYLRGVRHTAEMI